jgi:hypothetical protein
VCPGPFDVVIERRTVQVFDEAQRADALSALSKRLSRIGIFLSMCLDDSFPMEWGWAQHESGFFHSSESWFQEEGWTIWDGVPSSPLQGRVAWLVRCGSMKPPPRSSRAKADRGRCESRYCGRIWIVRRRCWPVSVPATRSHRGRLVHRESPSPWGG